MIFAVPVKAQKARIVSPPDSTYFIEIVQHLSSEKMKGREVGTVGGYLAADFIASEMAENGLVPAGDFIMLANGTKKQTYFQEFELWKYKATNAHLHFFEKDNDSKAASLLHYSINFDVIPCSSDIETSAEIVFAGYGLVSPDSTYNDFEGVDVKNKIVLLLNGFPGHADTNSLAWSVFGKVFAKNGAKLHHKLHHASNYGALAIIIVDAQSTGSKKDLAFSGSSLRNIVYEISGNDHESYPDFSYMLPSDSVVSCLPAFIIDSLAATYLIGGTTLNFDSIEKKINQTGRTVSYVLPEKMAKFSVEVFKESIIARNVLGMIPGIDTTSTLITGGHYDHLGVRGEVVYFGADDNASGAAGVLSLSKNWNQSEFQPAHNMLFACWDAEEKGLLGSEFFVDTWKFDEKEIGLYINMDMIARSAAQDSLRRQLSIGFRKADTKLFQTAIKTNTIQKDYFELDLWDVTGHSGSDYAAFIRSGVPVMTFFSGFHNDYHSPRDIHSKLDYDKMSRILKFVNDCLIDYSIK